MPSDGSVVTMEQVRGLDRKSAKGVKFACGIVGSSVYGSPTIP